MPRVSKEAPHVLVTGAGGSIAVNLTRSLKKTSRRLMLFGCDSSRYFIHLAETEEKAVIPSAAENEAYLQGIQKLIQHWKIDVVFPSNINEILVLARHRHELGARVLLPDLKSIEIGADKWRTFEEFQKAGLPVPRTELIREPKDVDHAFAQFGEPVWFRGRGIPGRGVGVASLPAKAIEEAKGWIQFHDAWGHMTAAEFLPGDNLTWMGLWKEGELIASQGRKRVAYVIPHVSPSGVTGAPAVSHTVSDERLNDLGPRAMLALDAKYNGVGFVDFKCDGKGNPLITEVNVGRLGTTHHFYTIAGANFPYWYVQLALGELPQNAKPHNVVAPDLYWIRSLDAGPVLIGRDQLDRYGKPSR